MKRCFVGIRYSQLPFDTELEIVLIEPSKCISLMIPRVGNFVVYKAYFTHTGDKRIFNITFPEDKFREALLNINPELRSDLTRPVKFKFKKVKRSLFITEYTML